MKISEPISILYVDDEEKALKHFSRAFSKDFNVLTASSYDSALEQLASHDIAILISDERMPNQSGVELLKQAKQTWPHVIRLLTTAYTDFDKLRQAINQANIFRFISKPWDLNDLKKVLQEAADFYFLNRQKQNPMQDNSEQIKNLGNLFSHEFSSPLLSIDLNAKVLDKFLKQNPAVQEYSKSLPNDFNNPNNILKTSERIQSAVTQIRALLNMLTFATCDNFEEMYFTDYSMAECVAEALEYYPFDDHQRKLIEYTVIEDFIFYGSKELMTAVLFNLLKNALRAIRHKNDSSISISVKKHDQHNELIFHDTGIGISETDLPHIFSENFSTKTEPSGLGLPLCRKIIESFNGNIDCTSKEKSYTQFTITLPQITTATSLA
ncbi:MAG: hybrid sensor histidine kinase/response regulator [Pseudomonadota bacterium]